LTVTFTGARTLPNTGLGSKDTGMKHIDPSRTMVVLKIFFIAEPADSDGQDLAANMLDYATM